MYCLVDQVCAASWRRLALKPRPDTAIIRLTVWAAPELGARPAIRREIDQLLSTFTPAP